MPVDLLFTSGKHLGANGESPGLCGEQSATRPLTAEMRPPERRCVALLLRTTDRRLRRSSADARLDDEHDPSVGSADH
jgi:hypothetical protein